MGKDGELLAQRELDDGLVLAGPEQSEDAPKERDRESRYGPLRRRILLESRPRREPESGLTLRLSFEDECGHRREKTVQNQRGRIVRIHTPRYEQTPLTSSVPVAGQRHLLRVVLATNITFASL